MKNLQVISSLELRILKICNKMNAAYIIISLDMVNLYMFNSILVKQAMGMGASYIFLGVLGSCQAFLSVGWKPIAGNLSDKKGTTKLVFWCLVANFLGTLLAFLSSSLLFLFLSRLILAFASPVQILLRTILTNFDKDQSGIVAKTSIVTALSFIGAALVYAELLQYSNGMQYIYVLMLLNISASIILTKTLPSSDIIQKQESQLTKSPFEEVAEALKNLLKLSVSENYWDVFLIKCFAALSAGTILSNMMVIHDYRGMTDKNIGYLVTVICLVAVLSNILLIKVNKLFYKNDVGYVRVLHASVMLFITLLVQGFSSNMWIYVIFANIVAGFRCMMDNSCMELLLNKVNQKEKAMVLGCFDSIQSLTDLIVPIVSSTILQFSGVPTIYLVSALFMALVFPVEYRRRNKLKI